ncbi:phosphoenolpyruvate--protein phosphotransferase [Methylacidimicrobium tartarophylax]|uniref:Phosphoenolpyruvate-protein phosphotransferase n=1 Tax=Methylacidimicrobium tartarophylax TaxID=1041768 RepID=A0A5E6MC96_9BACT|nr:phosphoenolpyruvate--protein phosphotransferase [Methylacidimicrobium tartarophylax]VVM07066.1 PTS system, fructose-specific IIA component,PTS-Fru-EIIB, fruA; PTS system, fructose-specific IIB component,PTS-Fru-EIIC, fruA; PTS system, fructose-specific IIC component [Methylacidimicrobium tartarophylax]
MSGREEECFAGTAAAPGVGVGPGLVVRGDHEFVRRRPIELSQIPAELERLEIALLKTREELLEAKAELVRSWSQASDSLFEAHLLAVEDPTILEAVKRRLELEKICVEAAYQEVIRSFVEQMQRIDDVYLRERALDVRDVGKRVLRNLRGDENAGFGLDQPGVVVADSLLLSDLVSLDRRLLLGLVTEEGSQSCHAAILAQSLNIPAVVGVRDILNQIEEGTEVLVDGFAGVVILRPSEERKVQAQAEQARFVALTQEAREKQGPAVTIDGQQVRISANVELPEDLPLIRENGADGVGLYRTEFLFLRSEKGPSEEEQFALYREAAEWAKPNRLVIRTLDVGGDKLLPWLSVRPLETNPFLGIRGIRLSLQRQELFRTQLRAILRASTQGNVALMFPMVTDVSEFRRARELLGRVRQELEAEGHRLEDVPCGMMIETPAAALMADLLAEEADFFSIGTNDLEQYTLAVDRLNDRVSSLYPSPHPAVLRLIQRIVEEARKHGRPVGVCGEMASNLALLPFFVALGVEELSMGSVLIPRVKTAVRRIRVADASEGVNAALLRKEAPEVLEGFNRLAEHFYPELLAP